MQIFALPIACLLFPLCFSRPLFPGLRHFEQNLAVVFVHRLRNTDAVGRIFPVRFRVFHCIGLRQSLPEENARWRGPVRRGFIFVTAVFAEQKAL